VDGLVRAEVQGLGDLDPSVRCVLDNTLVA
jgi:hypothetical protein